MSFSRLVAGVILVLSVFVSSTVDADTKPLEKPREPIVLKAPPSRTVVVPDLPVRRDCEDIGSANCKENPLPLPVDLESRRDALRKDLGRSTTAETDSATPAVVVGPDQAVISGKVLRNGLWPVAGAEVFFKGEINGVLRTLPVNGTTEIKAISAASMSTGWLAGRRPSGFPVKSRGGRTSRSWLQTSLKKVHLSLTMKPILILREYGHYRKLGFRDATTTARVFCQDSSCDRLSFFALVQYILLGLYPIFFLREPGDLLHSGFQYTSFTPVW